MSKKKPISRRFNENAQRIFFSIIIIACLLIIIGILNLNLEFKTIKQNQNIIINSQVNTPSLPVSAAIYSRFGQITDLDNNTIKLQVTSLGKIEQYTIIINEDTTFTDDSPTTAGGTTILSLVDLKIGNSISVISDQNIKNESSWLAQRIELKTR